MAFRKKHRTAKGKTFDMDNFIRENERVIAVGNLGGEYATNARGDILGRDGKIIKKRDEVVRDYYRNNLPKIKEQSIQREIEIEKRNQVPHPVEIFDDPATALAKLEEEIVEYKEPEKKAKPKKTKKKENKNEQSS